MNQQSTDRVFAEPLETLERFAFNDDVASVFNDMIERSVPGYRSIVTQTGLLAARFAKSNSHCYDLGCSLGESALSMRHQLDKLPTAQRHNISIVAVDNSSAMLSRLQHKVEAEKLNADPSSTTLQIVEADITKLAFKPCSVAVLNFTLQFIPREERQALIYDLAQQLLPGGVLILSEKIRFDDSAQQRLHTDMYENFKRANGYSDLEISQKRDALENVLVPETLDSHKKRLLSAGFSSVEVWFQCFNFLSMVALK